MYFRNKLTTYVLALQLALLGIHGLHAIGFDIPLIGQIIAFIYLTFVPGFLILTIINIQLIDKWKIFLYSAGLSIIFIIFSGFILNMALYYTLGVSKPISTLPILIFMSSINFLLLFIIYTNKRFSNADKNNITLRNSSSISNPYLFLFILPILVFFGAHFIDSYRDNRLMVFVLLLIVLIPALVVIRNHLPDDMYPLTVFILALSISFHKTLISSYIYFYNLDFEYYSSNFVASQGYWDATYSSLINSLLSIVMVAPIYSKIMNIDLIWVFKIIYPFFLSLVPVAIYLTVREQFGQKIAFCSSVYFASSPSFFGSLLLFGREIIACIFISQIVLVLVDKEVCHVHKTILIIIFLLGLPVSHYGLTYLFIILLINGKIMLSLYGQFSREQNSNHLNLFKSKIILFTIVFTISWFIYIAHGSSFQHIIDILSKTILSLDEFLRPNSRPEIAYAAMGGSLLTKTSLIGWIFRLLNYIIELSIISGFFVLLSALKNFEFNKEYKAIMIANFLFMLIILVPFWDRFLGMYRLLGFVLLTCSPFVILGFESGLNIFLKLLSNIFNINYYANSSTCIKILMICVILPVFTLNIGLFSEIAKGHLDLNGVGNSPVLERWNGDNGYFSNEEVSAAIWLKSYSNVGANAKVLSDSRSIDMLTFWFPNKDLYINTNNITSLDYLYLRRWNIVSNEFIGREEIHKSSIVLRLNSIPLSNSKIFDSNNSKIILFG